MNWTTVIIIIVIVIFLLIFVWAWVDMNYFITATDIKAVNSKAHTFHMLLIIAGIVIIIMLLIAVYTSLKDGKYKSKYNISKKDNEGLTKEIGELKNLQYQNYNPNMGNIPMTYAFK